MGVVFKARDLLLGRAVALKVLSRDLLDSDTAKKRFLREGQLAASVAHPHIATIYEIGEAEGVVYIAMELVEGRNLKELIHDGPLSVAQVISIGRQTSEALEAAHQQGVRSPRRHLAPSATPERRYNAHRLEPKAVRSTRLYPARANRRALLSILARRIQP